MSGRNNCPLAQNQEFGGKISEEKEIPPDIQVLRQIIHCLWEMLTLV